MNSVGNKSILLLKSLLVTSTKNNDEYMTYKTRKWNPPPPPPKKKKKKKLNAKIAKTVKAQTYILYHAGQLDTKAERENP